MRTGSLAAIVFAATTAFAAEQWVRVDGAHVRLYSDGSPQRAARDLHAFMETLEKVLGPPKVQHPEPCTTVILFANREEPGYSLPSPRTTYLVAGLNAQLYRDVAGSYIRAHFPSLPAWLQAGLIETLGTFEHDGTRATVASLRTEHVRWLWARRHELDVTDPQPAVAWGLTQLLVFERPKGLDALRRFLAGDANAFGEDHAKALRGWISARNVTITPFEVPLDRTSAPAPRPVPRAEVLVHLGRYREALAEDPDNAEAHAMLGLTLKPDEAFPHLEAAVRAGYDDPEVRRAYEQLLAERNRPLIAAKLKRANELAAAGQLGEARRLIGEVLAQKIDDELRQKLEKDLEQIELTEETVRLTEVYNRAVRAVNEGRAEEAWPLVEQILRETRDPGLRRDAEKLKGLLPPRRDRRLAWLADNAVELNDLEPLRQTLKNARVVLLGEQSHADGTAFLAKTRLIKFLHEEMGFDVLAFESGLYDCAKAWELLKRGEPARTAVPRGVFAIWTRTRELQPLIDYLGARAKSDRPLELAGVDNQLTGTASRDFLVHDLAAFLSGIDPKLVEGEEWSRVVRVLDHLFDFSWDFGMEPVPSPGEQAAFARTIGRWRAAIAACGPSPENAFWHQFLDSLRTTVEQTWRTDPADHTRDVSVFAMRDLQMGKNLVWLAKERYPDRRIIVWAATFHNARNLAGIETIEKHARLYRGTTPMGEVAWKALGNQVYSLGFTSAEAFERDGKPIPPPSTGSLEDLCLRAGLRNAVIDFRRAPAWLRQPLVGRLLGHVEMRADWTRVVDGVVFLRRIERSTRTQTAP